MKRFRSAIVAATVAVFALGVVAPAAADAPGPGDKQCVPGQNPQPKPAQKGGTCPPKKTP